jgi:hypothetical protein
LVTSANMIRTCTVKNTDIGRGRTRQAGCSVNIDSIHAASTAHSTSTASSVRPWQTAGAVRARIASST